MLFNSFEFLLFLPIVFACYWFVLGKNRKLQNAFLLIASYLFYGWWDWRFLSLLFVSSLNDFWIGWLLGKNEIPRNRKLLLALSMAVNLGILGFFKYYNFFLTEFMALLESVGFQAHSSTLQIILPVGISFYTFQTMSYTIDVYRRKLEPSKSWLDFFAYVSFFPQLVAGPIERAVNLLPQFGLQRAFSYAQARSGLQLILWGAFKKIVIADNCAPFVSSVFQNYETMSGIELAYGAVLFAFQIYGDFSGYSDIAIGVSRLFGFDLMINFRTPYFSRDIAEFWRRWHISLSTWFRDYLYIPLGGSRGSTWLRVRNTFIIFLVSGFWHGANWTFIVWGGLNALYFLPMLLAKQNRNNLDTVAENSALPNLREVVFMLFTFAITCLAWVFFRAETVTDAMGYLSAIITNPVLPQSADLFRKFMIPCLLLFLWFDWQCRISGFDGWMMRLESRIWRHTVYYTVTLTILFFGAFEETPFIYFQF